MLDYGLFVKMIEVKCTSTPNERHFSSLAKMAREFRNASGYLVSFAQERVKIAKNVEAIPWIFINDVVRNQE
jgi:hypothetical protein